MIIDWPNLKNDSWYNNVYRKKYLATILRYVAQCSVSTLQQSRTKSMYDSMHFYTKICWHDDVIKWKHFPRNWPFVRGIHRDKGQWRGALMFSLICVWINGWVNNRESGDLRRHLGHYDVIVMTVECQYNIDTAEVLKTFTLYIFLENISAAILIVIWSWDMFYFKIDPSCLAFRGHIHTTSTILREIIVSSDKESISIW